MSFPIIPALYEVVSKDPSVPLHQHLQPTQMSSEMPSKAVVILGSCSTPRVVKEVDVPVGTIATGQVISGYNQKQRAALRKGKRDGL